MCNLDNPNSIPHSQNSPNVPSWLQTIQYWFLGRVARATSLHRDERGVLSALTVIIMLCFAMLLAMIINVGRHIDDKIKMQNAADASAYSSTLIVARGMNALAFSNHLMCDTFALTAYLREARDQNAESQVPPILAAWEKVGAIFSRSSFDKFNKLGSGIERKVVLEQQAVRTFGQMSKLIAKEILPVTEYTLRERLIPEFQRSVVRTVPGLAQTTANELGYRHSLHRDDRQTRRENRERGRAVSVLWRTSLQPAGYPDEMDPMTRTLPAVDPAPGDTLGDIHPIPDPNPDGIEGQDYQSVPKGDSYMYLAIRQRNELAHEYLRHWVGERLEFFRIEGKMSQYHRLYYIYACGQLNRLLNEEYPYANIPHIIRQLNDGREPNAYLDRNQTNLADAREYLETNFNFIGVAYRRRMKETMPGLFKYPLGHDPLTFAQTELFIPEARLWYHEGSGGGSQTNVVGGNVAFASSTRSEQGESLRPDPSLSRDHPYLIPGGNFVYEGSPPGYSEPGWFSEGWPRDWSLFNQNWTVRLVPATHSRLLDVLTTYPPAEAIATGEPLQVVLPPIRSLDMQVIREINNH